MEISKTFILIVAVLAIVLVVFLIRKNNRDLKTLEKELNQSHKAVPQQEKEYDEDDGL